MSLGSLPSVLGQWKDGTNSGHVDRFTHSLTHSVTEQMPSTYYMPDTNLGAEDAPRRKRSPIPAFKGSIVSWER